MVGYLYFDEHQPNPWDRPLKNFFNLSEIHSNRIYQGAPIHKSSHYYSGKANELYQRAQTAIQKAQSPKGLSSEDLFKTPRSQTDLLRMVLLVVHLGKPVDKLKEERISLECQHYELSLLLAASEQVKAKIEKPISSLKDVELQTSLKRECYNLSRCIDVTRYTINTLKQWQEYQEKSPQIKQITQETLTPILPKVLTQHLIIGYMKFNEETDSVDFSSTSELP